MSNSILRSIRLQQDTPIRKRCSECGTKNSMVKGKFENFRWGRNKEMISTVCDGCSNRCPN